MTLIAEELQLVAGLETKTIWDMASPLVDEGWLLWGAGGRLSITHVGIGVAETRLREWVVGKKPRAALSELLERAHDLQHELEWQRFRLMQTIRDLSRSTSSGWAEDIPEVIEHAQIGESAFNRAYFCLESLELVKMPGGEPSLTLTIKGERLLQQLEEVASTVAGSNEIAPREFKDALPRIWSRGLQGRATLTIGVPGFPTPPGSTWKDVHVQFVDSETVRVRIKDVSRAYNFAEMGMSDRRTATPDSQWKLLQDLAEGRGVLSWDSTRAYSGRQKTKERLAELLQGFFRIYEEPIPWAGREWKTKFDLSTLD